MTGTPIVRPWTDEEVADAYRFLDDVMAERDRYREALRELSAAVEDRSGASSRGGQWSIHYLTSQWDRLMDAREQADNVIRAASDEQRAEEL